MKEEKDLPDNVECKSEQETVNVYDKELLLLYTKEFLKEDIMNCVYYCSKWNGTNEIYFAAKLPEDFIFDLLGRINEGKRKVYTDAYKYFKGSVYYHLKNELLTYFNCRKKKELTEDSSENFFTREVCENYFEDGEYADGAEDVINRITQNELHAEIFRMFNPDEDIEEILVLDEILKGKKRAQIAEALGLPVKEVTNIQKRIHTRIEKNFDKKLLEGTQ